MTLILIILGIIAICLVCFAGKALLAVLEFILDMLGGLFSSGCFWWFVGIIFLLLFILCII